MSTGFPGAAGSASSPHRRPVLPLAVVRPCSENPIARVHAMGLMCRDPFVPSGGGQTGRLSGRLAGSQADRLTGRLAGSQAGRLAASCRVREASPTSTAAAAAAVAVSQSSRAVPLGCGEAPPLVAWIPFTIPFTMPLCLVASLLLQQQQQRNCGDDLAVTFLTNRNGAVSSLGQQQHHHQHHHQQ
ncbi:unnamed protein product [Lampetra fluviatilis]